MKKRPGTYRPKPFLISIILIFLSSCLDRGWSPESLRRAKAQFNKEAFDLAPEKNLSIRYKNLAKGLSAFPDAMQTMDEICQRGLPTNHGHLVNWVKNNSQILNQLESFVWRRDLQYKLRYEDVSWQQRLEKIVQLSNLLLIDAALKLKAKDYKEATLQTLRTSRICNHLTQEGLLRDFYVANLIHRRCSQLLSRLLPHLDERFLKETIVELEVSLRRLGTEENLNRTLARLAPAQIMEWLKPLPEDSFFERVSQPNAQDLQDQVDEIFSLRQELLNTPLTEIFQKSQWKELVKEVGQSGEFIRRYFNYNKGPQKTITNLFQSKIQLAYIKIRNEMLQIQAIIILECGLNRRQWPEKLDKFINNIYLCHQTLGKSRFSPNPREKSFQDPFSQRAYGFRVENDVATLWSIGPDFQDDGGLEIWDGRQGDLMTQVKP